jgi:hypothetical protein
MPGVTGARGVPSRPAGPAGLNPQPSPRAIATWGFLVSALLAVGISSQSLWIDEGVAFWIASQKSLGALSALLGRLHTSDPQMPLYLVYLWGWIRLFGTGEVALRLSNLPFALLLATAFSWLSCRLFGRRRLLLLVGLSPFLWFYMNEARPYLPVVGLSTLCVVATVAYLADHRRYRTIAPWLAVTSLLLLCAFYLLGAFLGLAAVVLVILETRRGATPWTKLARDWTLPVFVSLPLFALVGFYYSLTLLRGAGGARGVPGAGNLGFAVYEFLGFAGLRPPRNDLRANPHLSTFLPYWPWLCLGGLAGAGLILVVARALRVRRRGPAPVNVLVSLGVGVAMMTVAAQMVRFQFWGRRLAPLFPLFVLCVAQGLSLGLHRPGSHGLPTATFLIVVLTWTVSDVRLRWMPEYRKDDYRLAAEIAIANQRSLGATIAWVADGSTAQYYGLRLDGVPFRGDRPALAHCLSAANWSERQVRALVARSGGPVVLVLSKPDLYDRRGAWRAAVTALAPHRIASPNAFDIYLFDRAPQPGLHSAAECGVPRAAPDIGHKGGEAMAVMPVPTWCCGARDMVATRSQRLMSIEARQAVTCALDLSLTT